MNSIIYYVFVIIWMALYLASIVHFMMILEVWDWEQHLKDWETDELLNTCRNVDDISAEYKRLLNDKKAKKDYHKTLILFMLVLIIPNILLMIIIGLFKSVWGWITIILNGISGVVGVVKLKEKLAFEERNDE